MFFCFAGLKTLVGKCLSVKPVVIAYIPTLEGYASSSPFLEVTRW